MTSKTGSSTFDVQTVRKRLSELGGTQGMLAAYLGVDTSAISKGFAGKRKFSPYEQSLVSKFLSELEHDLDATGLRTGRVDDVGRVENLRHQLDYLGMSKHQLAMASGVSVRDITRILQHIGSPMTDQMAKDFSAALGTDIDGPRRVTTFASEPAKTQMIPIYAAPTPAMEGLFDYLLSPAGSVEAPPFLRDVPGAFAMYGPEFGIGKRWNSGDVLFLHPRLPLAPDSEAMVVMDEQFLSIGRVVANTADSITLQTDTQEPRNFPRSRLTGIWKIAGAWFR